jgi:hypothetical protein
VIVLNPSILYENRGPVALWVKGAVISSIDRIRPFPEVEAVETIVAQIDDSWLGGGTPPVVNVV